MWLFASGGLLLPALIPEKVLAEAKTKDIKLAVKNGWDVQVRGRVTEHLKWFADTYMEKGTYGPIIESPDKDYNCRFYTSRQSYGEALLRMSLAMDYTKFKDTSLRFPWGHAYHSVLLTIWSISQRLAPAGGPYAPYSKANPRGFKPYKPRGRGRSAGLATLDRVLDEGRVIGESGWADEDFEYESAPFDFDPDRDYSIDPVLSSFLDTYDRDRATVAAQDEERKSQTTRRRFNRRGRRNTR